MNATAGNGFHSTRLSRGAMHGLLVCLIILLALSAPAIAGATGPGNCCVPPPQDLVSWWPADGNADDIADANNGTLVGGATFAAGQVGQAFLLDGIDDYVDLGNAANLHVSGGDFTVDAWVLFNALSHPPGMNLGAPQGDMSIVDKMSASGVNTDGWRLLKQDDNRFWFCLGGGAGNQCANSSHTVFSTTQATTGAWFHVAAVKSSTSFSIYVNGQLEDTRSPLPTFLDTDSANLRIGSYMLEGSHLNGLVDEVEIYNRALNTSEIQAIFNAGSAGKCKSSPPDCSGVSATPSLLWPPDHKFRRVSLSGASDPDGDPLTLTVTGVTQDEPLNGLGDGHTAPDARAGAASNEVFLRAERSGKGNGRVYRISYVVSDGVDSCTGTATVGVPHDRGGTVVDSAPPSFNSFNP